jgi:membrane-bound lytic murein transglycosylase
MPASKERHKGKANRFVLALDHTGNGTMQRLDLFNGLGVHKSPILHDTFPDRKENL